MTLIFNIKYKGFFPCPIFYSYSVSEVFILRINVITTNIQTTVMDRQTRSRRAKMITKGFLLWLHILFCK